MSIAEIFIIAVSLAMDAFAVSVTNGMCCKKKRALCALICGITFGFFQGAMPSVGYGLGMRFSSFIQKADHWIALILLGAIGINMIRESGCRKESRKDFTLSFSLLLLQGFATSVDALAAGISFAVLGESIVFIAAVIAAVTAVISIAGFMAGSKAGALLSGKAQIAGGALLIGIGVKIFIQHTIFS